MAWTVLGAKIIFIDPYHVTDASDLLTKIVNLAMSTTRGFMYLAAFPGSTSEPKGVMITHSNLANNLKLIVKGLSAIDDTVVVSWLPQVRIFLPA